MIVNVADLLSQARTKRPDGVAVVTVATDPQQTSSSATWAEVDDLAGRTSAGLERLGLVAGNRVLIATGNRLEFVATYFAVLRARLVAVPVNPRSAGAELRRMAEDSGARVLVADASTVELAREVAREVPTLRLVVLDVEPEGEETGYEDLTSQEADVQPVSVDPESLAVLLYTSGATGAPRAAMLTHRALVANIDQVASIEPAMVHPDDVVYGVLPLFHVYGLNAVLGQVVRQAATIVLTDSFHPTVSLEHIARYSITVVPVAPAVLAHWRGLGDPDGPDDGPDDGTDLLDAALTSVRMLLSGSAPLPPELVADFTARTGIEVHQGYGLTEAAPVVTSTLGSTRLKPGSVGVTVPGVHVRLVDDTGARLGSVDDPGEIQVSGPNLFNGYWPDGDGAPVEGWFATGDVGYLDEDGDLFLVDRLKELVIVSGFNVYPSEIEDVVAEVDGVREVAVIGVPDDSTGEAVVAYVRPTSPDDPGGTDALVEAIRSSCERRLARFKWPSRIEVVTDLPRTVTGKVAKGRMRATVRRERLGLLE